MCRIHNETITREALRACTRKTDYEGQLRRHFSSYNLPFKLDMQMLTQHQPTNQVLNFGWSNKNYSIFNVSIVVLYTQNPASTGGWGGI